MDTLKIKLSDEEKEFLLARAVPGTQVIYVPDHAGNDLNHEDCEKGFITSIRPEDKVAFVRYFSKHHPDQLRTMCNSECTQFRHLILADHHDQAIIDAMLRKIMQDQ